MTGTTANLGAADTERLADFLVDHMGMETRRKLMTELPIVYARLYPDVRPDVILGMVERGISDARVDVCQRCGVPYHAVEVTSVSGGRLVHVYPTDANSDLHTPVVAS